MFGIWLIFFLPLLVCQISLSYTATSRKVVGKSVRDNSERYYGWFLVHCSSKKFERMSREAMVAMDLCLRVLKESNQIRLDSCSVSNSVFIIRYACYLSGLSCAHFSDNLSRNSCMPRACVSFSPAPNQWGTFQRKYRTRFSCAISAFLLHHQIRQPSTYIEPNDSILFQNFLFSGESNEAQEQRKSHDKRMTRRNVLCHVSRNRPHPTIYFPFQTGDRVRNKYCWKKFFIFFSLIATLIIKYI